MLVDHVIESQDAGLMESILMPFDIYNDSAQHALTVLKQRFLYDEIEAEVCNLGLFKVKRMFYFKYRKLSRDNYCCSIFSFCPM